MRPAGIVTPRHAQAVVLTPRSEPSLRSRMGGRSALDDESVQRDDRFLGVDDVSRGRSGESLITVSDVKDVNGSSSSTIPNRDSGSTAEEEAEV